ncbi:MAG TPA: flippase, partial [Nitrolancea sp.]|nr:flippase [Nitrolancea sp.]
MTERLIDSDFTIAVALAFGLVSTVILMAVSWIGIPSIERIAGNTVRRILTNSAVPIGAQLFNQATNLVFAIFMLRLLGVTGNGQ